MLVGGGERQDKKVEIFETEEGVINTSLQELHKAKLASRLVKGKHRI